MTAYFCFHGEPAVRLSRLTLGVGEESRAVMWRGEGPDDPVHSAFFFYDYAKLLMDEVGSSAGPPRGYFRLLRFTGRTPGAWRFEAMHVPRTGPSLPLGRLDIDVREPATLDADLLYTGKYLLWQRSVPPALGAKAPLLFHATSGLKGLQVGMFQSSKDQGPLPEGLYSFLTHVNPRQSSVEAANKREDALTNKEEGIEFLPVGGNGPVDTNWGTMRVRLTPLSGNMYGRGGFYLHNSHKGHSMGCVEVGPSTDGLDFFSALLIHAGSPSRKPRMTLRVKYSFPEQTTLGKTLTSGG
ncbi:DUF2778 domain-containing protein [Nonomuraea gerenzanensis]|uniref:DUF2778 domain-containing protein n=1 Tax=Nonomuraea gerenzanensis TaxID=93944 RepID=A0A1M4DYR8_9ACTN|nr:DUF2778 domain-containing protein [Nonomuraea gerenzanensis]UBU14032.1 DUF2778 domain-containing protein [Nonomuraea gerenzanensis]SBO91719.1 hypothetical protein BN4615_P1233 [Nonomuraea gerenzanensis]